MKQPRRTRRGCTGGLSWTNGPSTPFAPSAACGAAYPGDGDAARPALCALIDASARLGELLRALAPRCPAFCQALNAMAAAESAAQRRLRAEHFLASGENYCPGGACALVRDPLCALREAHSLSERLASRSRRRPTPHPAGSAGRSTPWLPANAAAAADCAPWYCARWA